MSSDLPNATSTLDLNVSALPTVVQDRIQLFQKTNHFMRFSELTLFPWPTISTWDDEDVEGENVVDGLRYF